MADRYINVAYVDARIDRSVRESLIGEEAAADELLRFIEDGTADTQAVMRNSGFTCPSTQDPTGIDLVVQRAVMCRVWESLATKPNASLPLPENWSKLPYREAWDGILSGALQPNMPQSTKNAPGGITIGTSVSRATDLTGW